MVLPCRIACLRIPRFQIVAHQKAEPVLKGKPLVLLEGSGVRARVLLCSREAEMQRVYCGMKFSEARAVCADLLWREYDEGLYKKVQAEIVQRLALASPQVSGLDTGTFLLDATGLTLLGGEGKFCRELQRLANTAGFVDVHIGIADTAFGAAVASKFKRSRYYIVPPGKDREFLSELSLEHMPVSVEMKETLYRLGIKSIGQLLQIPLDEMQERFGAEGVRALDLAGGIDKTQPQVVQAEPVYESLVDLSFPVDSLQQTQFILKSMLEKVCFQLKESSLLAEELLISFFNDNDKFDERPLKLLRPSSNSKFLLEIIRLSLEASPLAREYTGMHIRVTQLSRENWQQNKMRIVEAREPRLLPLSQTAVWPIAAAPQILQLSLASEPVTDTTESLSGAEPRSQNHASKTLVAEGNSSDNQNESFTLLLQRFIARLGAKSVVRPVANDQHLPDEAARFLPLVEATESVLPININFAGADTGASALACGLILKKSANPETVLVEYQGKTPTSITYQGRWHKIKELTEPERLSGLWWENPVRKSYYVALIEACSERVSSLRSSGARNKPAGNTVSFDSYLVLLVHDHNKNSWQLDGFFD